MIPQKRRGVNTAYGFKSVTVGSRDPEVAARRQAEMQLRALIDMCDRLGRALIEAKKARGTDGKASYALASQTQLGKLDPRTVTEADVREMLENVQAGVYDDNTYIPLRVSTPAVLIYWAKQKRGEVIDNNPIIISAKKARQAMSRGGADTDGRPHELTVDDMISISRVMSNPSYIVYQNANDRYVEVVEFDSNNGSKAFAILEVGFDKPEWTMNGFEAGLYNVMVTVFPPDKGKIKELLDNKQNDVIFDVKKDPSRSAPGSNVPSDSNDAPFYGNSISHPDGSVKTSGESYDLTGDHIGTRAINDAEEQNRVRALDMYKAVQNGEDIGVPNGMSVEEYIYNHTGWSFDNNGKLIVDHEAPAYLGDAVTASRDRRRADQAEAFVMSRVRGRQIYQETTAAAPLPKEFKKIFKNLLTSAL